MLNMLLQVYEKKILQEGRKDLRWFGLLYIVICSVSMFFYLLFGVMRKYIAAVIAIAVLIIVSIIFMIIVNKFVKYDEQSLKRYKEETVDKFRIILKEAELDRKTTIEVIISQCEEYEKRKGSNLFGEWFKSVFTLIVYPIITACAAIIVKDMSDQHKIEWSIFIICMIIIVYIMFTLLYPVIDGFVNKYKIIAKMMRQDLEYILTMRE